MVGRKLPITAKDRKTLLVFFTKSDKNYLQLLDAWKSTNEISEKLNESSDKTLRILKKLHGFGFLFGFSINYKNSIHRYWAINRNGIYFILSTLRRDKLAAFLKTNEKKIKEFSDIGNLVLQKDEQVSYLTRRINDIVKNYQFDLLENFIETWRRTNTIMQHAVLRYSEPDRKKVFERYKDFDKKMMSEIMW